MIYILLPVHNRVTDTLSFIACCEQQTFKDFQLVIIDDGSTDGTHEKVAGMYPWIHMLRGDGHLWWTGAINMGLKYVLDVAQDDDFLMTINNDVIIGRDFLELMHQTAVNHIRTIFNPISVSLLDRKSVHFTGTKVISWALAIKVQPYYGRPLKTARKERMIEVDYLSGRGTVIPVRAFKEIGIYNQALLPHYGADDEFTCRAKKHGYRICIDTHPVVFVERKTTGQNPLDVRMSFKQKLKSFVSRRSTNNIRTLFRFSRLCAPTYAVPSYFLVSLIKILMYNFILNPFIVKDKSSH